MKRRAFTLPELLIWSVLAGIMLTLGFLALRQLVWTSRRETELSQAYLSGLTAVRWLTDDLRYANAAGVIVHSGDPFLLSIHPPRDATIQQQPEFFERLVVYSWRGGELRRSVLGSPPFHFAPVTPLRPGRAELEAALDLPHESRLLASRVVAFKIENKEAATPAGRVSSPLRIEVEVATARGERTFRQVRSLAVRTSL